MRALLVKVLIALACATAASGGAAAQSYPTAPIKLVLPYAPGGIVDAIGRIVAQKLSEELGQSVIADNRPGAGGMSGTSLVAKSQPDGYTLLMMDPAIVINPSLQESVPYDLFADLTAVSMVSTSPLVLVVNPSLPVHTFADLVAYGKAHPNELNYASAGIGTTPHLAGELWRDRTGVQATHVPYRGIGPAFTDLVAGKVQMSFSSIAGALPFTKSNQLRALATTGAQRSKAYPDTPTVIEGGLADFKVDLWLAIFVPIKTPNAIVAKLNEALSKSLKSPDVIAAMASVGVEPNSTSAAAANHVMHDEYDLWRKVIEDAHLK